MRHKRYPANSISRQPSGFFHAFMTCIHCKAPTNHYGMCPECRAEFWKATNGCQEK